MADLKVQLINQETRGVMYPETLFELIKGLPPQPNLLTNSDWASGVINSFGWNAYAQDGEYTFDCWYINGTSYFAVLDENGNEESTGDRLSFTNQGDYARVRQILLNSITGTFTFAVNVLKQNDMKMYVLNSDNQMIEKDLEEGINTITYTGTITEVGFYSNVKDGNVLMNFCKLEAGSFYTGMPVWDEILEKLKCNCRLVRCKFQSEIVNINYNATQVTYSFPLPVELHKTPSVFIPAYKNLMFPQTIKLRKEGSEVSVQITGVANIVLNSTSCVVSFSIEDTSSSVVKNSVYASISSLGLFLDAYDYPSD